MVEIHHQGFAEAPVGVAFGYVDDYRNVPTWMFGVSRFEPVDPDCVQGLGSVFDAVFQVKPVSLKTRVEITGWRQDELIELTSIKGFRNSSSWRFEPAADGGTILHVTFGYELPGGLAGKALGRAIEPVMNLTVRQTDAALRKHIEAQHADQA